MREAYAIVDLQFGSCGKGLLAGYLARRWQPDTVVAAWAPNAGHTFVTAADVKYVNIALPTGIVSPRLKRILIGPGAVINPDLFMSEFYQYAHHLGGVDIAIHECAAVVNEGHRTLEAQTMARIGSTMKGVGAVTADKIRREPGIIAREALRNTPLEAYLVDSAIYADLLDKSELVQIEGAQGFSLGLNQGFYPYCTSRECTVQQIMSDCQIPYVRDLTVIGVARTYPIRVANRFDQHGQMIGTSGPCYPDQQEITWEEVGVEPELTTVTKLPRRVFTFSEQQVKEAIRMNGVNYVFLNFCNYVKDIEALHKIVTAIGSTSTPVRWLGYGPREDDVIDLYKGSYGL